MDWEFPAFPLNNIEATASADAPHAASTSQALQTDEDEIMRDLLVNGDADDEDDPRNFARSLSNRSAKTEAQNILHALIRDYLTTKSLYLSSRKIIEGAVLPFPDPGHLEYYETCGGRGGGPPLANPLYSWDKPRKHAWNLQLIRILAPDFENYVAHGGQEKALRLINAHQLEVINNASNDNLSASPLELKDILKGLGSVDIMASKLDLVAQQLKKAATQRRAFLERSSGSSNQDAALNLSIAQELESKRKFNRRGERRRGLYIRRDTIINEQVGKTGNVEMWKLIRAAFALLEDRDMSSDKTETEKGFSAPKIVRRRKKMWINPELPTILHYVDAHYNPRTSAGTLKKGSAPLKRETLAGSCDTVSPPRPKLPLNFYNIRHLGMETVKTLQPRELIELPQILGTSDLIVDSYGIQEPQP
ncbi:hypothetical protein CPB83DRAFT_899984 [Crepidotus variabilis]|uniref:Uncharacterized protein n=1 Tax=Crepidotus variabilis TaxID=179855 RepID=A0A9P6JII2_9AGAR|nr:hypothetical protein CPB83DRAFT_899984 [Crepidotus variabilis]